jgi:hypothetical protein
VGSTGVAVGGSGVAVAGSAASPLLSSSGWPDSAGSSPPPQATKAIAKTSISPKIKHRNIFDNSPDLDSVKTRTFCASDKGFGLVRYRV